MLTRVSGSVTTIVDYLNYTPINNDRSYGAFADGTPARRQKFYYATPGATNNNTFPGRFAVGMSAVCGRTIEVGRKVVAAPFGGSRGEFQFVTVPVVSAADGQSSRPFPEK